MPVTRTGTITTRRTERIVGTPSILSFTLATGDTGVLTRFHTPFVTFHGFVALIANHTVFIAMNSFASALLGTAFARTIFAMGMLAPTFSGFIFLAVVLPEPRFAALFAVTWTIIGFMTALLMFPALAVIALATLIIRRADTREIAEERLCELLLFTLQFAFALRRLVILRLGTIPSLTVAVLFSTAITATVTAPITLITLFSALLLTFEFR